MRNDSSVELLLNCSESHAHSSPPRLVSRINNPYELPPPINVQFNPPPLIDHVSPIQNEGIKDEEIERMEGGGVGGVGVGSG